MVPNRYTGSVCGPVVGFKEDEVVTDKLTNGSGESR